MPHIDSQFSYKLVITQTEMKDICCALQTQMEVHKPGSMAHDNSSQLRTNFLRAQQRALAHQLEIVNNVIDNDQGEIGDEK